MTTPTQGEHAQPKSTAADGKTELFNIPNYPLMVRAVDFNRLHAQVAAQPSAPQGGAYADAHGVIMGAAYDFRDAHISGSPNQKRSAHAALESAVTHALRASHGQAPADAVAEGEVMCGPQEQQQGTDYPVTPKWLADVIGAYGVAGGRDPNYESSILWAKLVKGINRFVRESIDADRAARAPADSVTAPAAAAANICIDCSNADSWGLPDKPCCFACVGSSNWEPLNKSSVHPNLLAAPQPSPTAQAADSVLEDAETALRKVLGVVQRYLPPGGPSIQDAMSEIIAIVDPGPVGISAETTSTIPTELSDDQIALMAFNDDPGDWNSLSFRDCWIEGYKTGASAAIDAARKQGANHD